jgi:hypothetical protein
MAAAAAGSQHCRVYGRCFSLDEVTAANDRSKRRTAMVARMHAS